MRDDGHEPLIPLEDACALLGASGEVVACNEAFRELCAGADGAADPTRLFGTAFLTLLTEAHRDGAARSLLHAVRGMPANRVFRVSARWDETRQRFGVLCVEVTDEVHWRRQLFERNRELTVLNEIGRALSGTLELDDLAQRIFEQTARIMRARSFYLALVDADLKTVSFPLYIEDDVPRQISRRAFGAGLTEHVLATRRPLLLNGDVLARAIEMGAQPQGRPCYSWLGVPMLAHDEAIGVIALQDFDVAGTYTEHDQALLAIIAAQAAASIHNARLFTATRSALEELSATQARLLQAERLRSITETVGALNHEVNNPLATIAGNAQLLLRHPERLPHGLEPKVAAILESARRIQRVTTKMASLIQATTRPYPGEPAILDVHRSLARPDRAETPDLGGVPPPDGEADTDAA